MHMHSESQCTLKQTSRRARVFGVIRHVLERAANSLVRPVFEIGLIAADPQRPGEGVSRLRTLAARSVMFSPATSDSACVWTLAALPGGEDTGEGS
jgi:hypothetical protein